MANQMVFCEQFLFLLSKEGVFPLTRIGIFRSRNIIDAGFTLNDMRLAIRVFPAIGQITKFSSLFTWLHLKDASWLTFADSCGRFFSLSPPSSHSLRYWRITSPPEYKIAEFRCIVWLQVRISIGQVILLYICIVVHVLQELLNFFGVCGLCGWDECHIFVSLSL